MNDAARALAVSAAFGLVMTALAAAPRAQSVVSAVPAMSEPAAVQPMTVAPEVPVAAPTPVAVAVPVLPPLPAGSLAEAIAGRLAQPLDTLDPKRPPAQTKLRAFYDGRGYTPAWFAGDRAGGAGSASLLTPQVQALRAVIAAADLEGLAPVDYHLAVLDARLEPRPDAADPVRRAELEILLTDALINYAGDIHRGRLAPQSIASEYALVPPALDVAAAATAALAAPDLKAYLATLAPTSPRYVRLREALRLIRLTIKAGGWPRVPEAAKLEPGAVDPAIRAVRRRLMVTGELDAKTPVTPVYDQSLKKAVQAFQARHGLPADGVIGTLSYAALNVSATEREASIIANLERERWMPPSLGQRHVLVNIPGFSLQVVIDGKVALEMPVIVGTKVRRTPIFASEINSLIWNPTWSVPRKLAREDILPKLRENANYLADQGIALYDKSFAGGKVDPTKIDWQNFTDIDRFRLRQIPGNHNALGQVKFNIPNQFDVYLHDTPHREKFVKSVRTFSSGCVRVGNPLGLADLLLGDMPEWPPERRKAALAKGDTRYVTLRSPIPVFLLYQTAWMDEQGVMQFREDIYGRDAQMLRALRRSEEAAVRPPVAAVSKRAHVPAPAPAPAPAQGSAQGSVSASAPARAPASAPVTASR